MALLGERIASLFDTAPEIDPEDVFDDTTIAKNEHIDTGIDIELNPSRMRDINLGASYDGQVVSRKQLNDDQWDNEIDDEYDEDSDLDSADTNELRTIPVFESSEDDTLDTNNANALMHEDEFDTLFEDENENTAGIDPEFYQNKKKNKHSIDRFYKGKESKLQSQNDESFNEFSSMMNKQMDKAEKLQKMEEEKQNFKVISEDKSGLKPQSFQLRKAKAVASQTKLYDKVATLRIHLQKPFQIAQKLPRPSKHCEYLENLDSNATDNKNMEKLEERKKLKTLLNEVSDEALSISDSIMTLQSKLLDKNEEYSETLRHRKRRRLNVEDKENGQNFEALWSEMSEDWQELIPHTTKTMDLWDRKMKLVEDYSSKKEKNKQNNQSLLDRIALIIDNPQRILSKMQSVDKLFKMYFDDDLSEDEDVCNDDEDDDDIDLNKKDERIRNGMKYESGNAKDLKFEKYRMECEVFNDAQFYRRMLKEIIDIGHAANFKADAVHKKMDKISEDRKNSKKAFHKAKLRMKYTIRPDMENFMAPIYNHDPEYPVEQLYNSLFQ